MAKMVPIMLTEAVLTIADDTPDTLNVLFQDVPNEGLVWFKVQTVTKTAGLTSVTAKWQPMGFKKGINSAKAIDLSTSGSAVIFSGGSAVDMSTVGYFEQFSLPTDCALQGSTVNAIHFEGVQFSLTGVASDDGTIWVSAWTWSY